jgi:phytoene synthase
MVSSSPFERPPVASDWEACRDVAQQHGKSFFLASQVLGARRKRAILAAYAFCRIADDIVDQMAVNGRDEAYAALEDWKRQLDSPTHPVAVAFADTRATFGVPIEPVLDLLAGLEMDLSPCSYETWHDLERYCFLVAGTVGLIVAPILGCQDRHALEHAAELGIAMQLTNILRDVAEDAEMGRLYLPIDELASYGIDPADVLNGCPGPRFPEFMRFQVVRARALYASAARGIPSLAPSGRAATLAASRLYAGILDEIEMLDHDVFQRRAYVPSGRKARIMVNVAGSWMTTFLPGGSRLGPRRTEVPAGTIRARTG